MPVLQLEFEVYCACGNGLCNQSTEGSDIYGRGQYITIEPCDKCLDTKYDEGYQEGYSEAQKDYEEE